MAPYKAETATANSQSATVRDRRVIDALSEYRLAPRSTLPKDEIAAAVRAVGDLPRSTGTVDRIVAVDGSRQETPIAHVDGGTVSACYVRVGLAAIDLVAQRRFARDEFVHPVEVAAAAPHATINYVQPGPGLTLAGAGPLDSWRAATQNMLARCEVPASILDGASTETMTLLTALSHLLSPTPLTAATEVAVRRCPACNTEAGDGSRTLVMVDVTEGGFCPECGVELFAIDALGLDEVFLASGREGALNALMSVSERLTLIALMLLLVRADPAAASRTLLVADGPLATFSPLQRLTAPMLSLIDAVAEDLESAGHAPMLLVGVEKGGNFAEHGARIAAQIPPEHVMRLESDYIRANITGRSAGGRAYGSSNMYGRRFFYRRHRDADGLLTITVPARAGVMPWADGAVSADWDSYPTLRAVIETLAEVPDRNYDSAILPLTQAHAAASIGLSADTSLASLAQKMLGLPANSHLKAARVWS